MAKHALILAGGGMKVAYQAGVLQVLLDEARLGGEPLDFFLADGASGGVFNLAMWAQGRTGTEIADNWRRFRPRASIAPNWRQLPRLVFADSLFTLDRLRRHVLPAWGLRWDEIRAARRLATFNLYNVTRQRLEVVTADAMTAEHLLAAVALPMWFPPVTIGQDRYIDAVFATDGNLEEAIRRGADELWVIWTVSRRGEWRRGFVAQYFQIIEAVANSRFDAALARIKANNAAIALGRAGEFGRHIGVRVLTADVPLNYLINFGRDRFAQAVNAGVRDARAWCVEQGLTVDPTPAPAPAAQAVTLRFTEQMRGEIAAVLGVEAAPAALHLTIRIHDLDRFVTEPEQLAAADGYLDCAVLGGRLRVARGSFNLLVDADKPGHKRMLYDLSLADATGGQWTLRAVKEIIDDPGADLWLDTTTAQVTVHEGWSTTGPAAYTGVVRIHLVDFLRQLTTFRVTGPTAAVRAASLVRFGQLFLGRLWDVYARDVLSSSPF